MSSTIDTQLEPMHVTVLFWKKLSGIAVTTSACRSKEATFESVTSFLLLCPQHSVP